jgi:hypothetical protein
LFRILQFFEVGKIRTITSYNAIKAVIAVDVMSDEKLRVLADAEAGSAAIRRITVTKMIARSNRVISGLMLNIIN